VKIGCLVVIRRIRPVEKNARMMILGNIKTSAGPGDRRAKRIVSTTPGDREE
jgi:hypothetical protein